MTENLKLLINFVWKFLGTVRFGNDHVAAILGFGDLQWGNILITRVYFAESLGHNLFSVGQFCDSDLEVAFRRNTCFVRNLKGVDLLKENRTTNLYTINLQEMAYASPICLMAHVNSIKSWLWHQRLSHLNFDTINNLAKNNPVTGPPKFKYHKEHLCPSCEQGKSKRASHPPKTVPNSKQRLHLLYMDLCGLMRVESINGKRYILVIMDDYSRYMWVHFIRSKDEAPKNQVLQEYCNSVGISHQASSVRTPQPNGAVERRNRTLVETARTMLIFLVHRYSYGLKELLLRATLKTAPLFTVDLAKQHTSLLTAENRISPFYMYSGLSVIPRMIMKIGKLGAKGLDLTYATSTITTQQPSEHELDLLFEAMYDDYIGGQPSVAPRTTPAAQAP
ncbi:retrovirus-related pol polyprotein from transposon TNT 1-94 [Tanacetum coccineum]